MTLPDFDLAPFGGFAPAELKVDTDLGRFALVLAAIFNDLKDAIYAAHMAHQATLVTSNRTPAFGQLTGMKSHALRTMFGVVRELMAEIREHHAVVESQEFVDLIGSLRSEQRQAWARLCVIATSADRVPNARDATSQILEMIRSNVAFHYNADQLAAAYQRFFAATPTTDDGSVRDQALVSNGVNMEGTRFYFAEAAVSELLVSWGLEQEALTQRILKTAEDVSIALKHIVMAYVGTVATVTPYRGRT